MGKLLLILLFVFFISALAHERDLYNQFNKSGIAEGIVYTLRCK
jgi:hypothetical protein